VPSGRRHVPLWPGRHRSKECRRAGGKPRAQVQAVRLGPRDIAERAFVNRYATWLKNESFLRFLVYGLLALGWEAVRLVRRYSNGGQLDWCEIRRRLALAWHAR